MAGFKRKPSKTTEKPPKRKRGPKQRADDIYEVDEQQAEEDKNLNKFDRIENYEYELPSDFEDEDIDDDMAFTAEDKQKYGDLYDNLNEQAGDEPGDDGGLLSDQDDEMFRGEGDGEEDWMGQDDDEDAADDGEQDDAKYQEMLRAAVGDSFVKERKASKRHKNVVISEAYPESEFNLNPMSASSGVTKELTVDDLIAGLGEDKGKLGKARKLLDKLSRSGKAVSAPLPRPVKERQERKAGYEHTTEEVTKWQPLVKANREAITLRFTSGREDLPRTVTTAAIVAKFRPETDMEAEVAAMLAAAGADTVKAVQESEEALAVKELTSAEAQARRERLARMRSLLFYHEMKSKRLKAIKSKEFHRKANKAAKRKAAAAAGGEDNQAGLRKMEEEAEFMRAKERLTLKHKNTSRWARRALKRGLPAVDDGTKDALAEQLRLGQELKRKPDSAKPRNGSDPDDSDASTSASDEEDESSGDDPDEAPAAAAARATAKTKAAAMEILAGAEGEGPLELPKKGLLSLPFMARALQQKRREAQEEAKALLAELEAEQQRAVARAAALAAGGDVEAADAAAADAADGAAAAHPHARMSFGRTAGTARAVDDMDEMQDRGDEGSDGDDLEDAEAKADRLRRASGGEAGPRQAGGTAADGRRARRKAAVPAPQPVDGFDPAALMSMPVGSTFADISGGWATASATPHPASGSGRAGSTSAPPQRQALFQPQSCPSAAAITAFIAAKCFGGPKEGYVFKKGPQGTGYYRDSTTPQPSLDRRDPAVVRTQPGALKAGKPGATTQAAEHPQANGSSRRPLGGGKQAANGTHPTDPEPAAGGNPRPAAARPAAAALGGSDDEGGDALMKPVGGDAELQRELVRRAFAGDDVEADFAKSKAEDAAAELPKIDEPSALPGWGSWAGAGKEPRWMAAQRAKAAKAKEDALKKRKDANMKAVVVSEKWDKKAAKYMAPQVPFPFDSKDVYERSIRHPLGREYNPDSNFRNLTRPAVLKSAGLLIEPIRYSQSMATSVQDGSANKELKPRLVNTVGAGVLRRTKGAK